MRKRIRHDLQAVGRYGETLAARYLQREGLSLIDRNWRGSQGEIDLIALDGETLVICEVKTRRSDDFGGPIVAVTPAKVERLRGLATEWLLDHALRVDSVRIDVVGVWVPPRGKARLEHLVGVQ